MASNDVPMSTEPNVTPEIMLAFYSRLYPFKSIFTWLSHSHVPSTAKDAPATRIGPSWTNREFAFTLKGDVYIRYNSFQDVEEFKKQVIKLNPERFEVGAIYNAKPRDKKTLPASALQPVRRELVFDIDMTDYDEIRTCCKSKSICKRCWGFIAAAVTVLDQSLRQDFGFRLLLWVYSGRRGIHCWVSDHSAMMLTDDQRKAIMGWLEVIKGGKEMTKKVNIRFGTNSLPPSIEASLNTLSEQYFIPVILQDQDCFGSKVGWKTLLELIPDRDVVNNLREKWENEEEPRRSKNSQSQSEMRWSDLKKEVKGYEKGTLKRNILTGAMEDIILQYTYPRLDAEVSKRRNHLLKAPFCIHPGTGRVCVPVDPAKVDEFEPEKVPSVEQLLNELDAAGSKAEDTNILGWESTSLSAYVGMLDEHNRRILQAERERKQAEGRKDLSW
ncbi:hypothetical protein FRC14_002587 [Serendipita sp. 396]|nr:hypothetical protein FRC14_002587 [Serendipita sp. 396]KAG8788473.1 hypothetical protein FRC15_004137 [Serendipita sp. 397]KAG8874683.1 hypothetical protein FRC20_005458 [Serendipita sp. 405]